MAIKIPPRLKTMIFVAGGIFAAVVGIALLLFAYPVYNKYFPHCPFYELTHLYCPGCGSTRAMFHLLHGNIIGVCRSNVLFFPSLGLVCCLLIFRRRQAFPPLILWVFVGLVIAFWILRNVPYYPFDLLAPAPIGS